MQLFICYEDYVGTRGLTTDPNDSDGFMEVDLPEAEKARIYQVEQDYWALQKQLDELVKRKK